MRRRTFTAISWTLPPALAAEPSLYCRVRFGTAANPTAVILHDAGRTGSAALPDALSAVPGLLPEGCVLGERYEDSCACGAAVIAMREAVHRMLEGELDG